MLGKNIFLFCFNIAHRLTLITFLWHLSEKKRQRLYKATSLSPTAVKTSHAQHTAIFSAFKASILTFLPPISIFPATHGLSHSVGKKRNRNAMLGKKEVMLHSVTLVSREMLERFQEKLLSNSWLAAEIMYIAYKALSSSFYAKVVFLRLHFFSPPEAKKP